MKKIFGFLTILAFIAVASAQIGTHSLTLTWAQSASAGVTGNNVYSSSVAGGPYTLLFSSPTPITSYIQSGLAAKTTLYYVITATCATCSPQESPYSNQASGTTLADGPLAPTGVTAVGH